ncbi:MAG TPA: LPXTG cell wall anchor domain-containing protein [Candidatus Nanoarchaeia archaeon]|nr:LPXTG cell wall anchor domain-containing protein [Candidatus Nanoarchaeia archaeon]
MVKKILGYILAVAGLASIALTLEPVKKLIKFPLPPQLSNQILIIAGIILLALGVFLSYKKGNGSKQAAEVPIYQGKNVVGYRRIANK